jgi:hypothetical protein
MRIAIGIAAALLLSAPAAASGEPAPPNARTGGDEIICKDAAGQTEATRLGRRKICMTKNEWRQLSQSDREDSEDIQRRSLATPPKQ